MPDGFLTGVRVHVIRGLWRALQQHGFHLLGHGLQIRSFPAACGDHHLHPVAGGDEERLGDGRTRQKLLQQPGHLGLEDGELFTHRNRSRAVREPDDDDQRPLSGG
jgi:hypothetical protein